MNELPNIKVKVRRFYCAHCGAARMAQFSKTVKRCESCVSTQYTSKVLVVEGNQYRPKHDKHLYAVKEEK